MLSNDSSSTDAPLEIERREGFVSPDGHRVIGTASAKPYTPTKASNEVGSASHHFFKRPPSAMPLEDDGTPKWELLAMAVDPTLQGKGLATQLMNLTIDEIKRRCGSGLREQGSSSGGQIQSAQGKPQEQQVNGESTERKLTLLLSTLKLLNEGYYAKRGWITTATRSFPPGTLDSRDGFEVVEMFRSIDL